jgi:glycosyltransferase involved in cell wall biosynthesis
MNKKIFIFIPSFESGGVERNAVIVANSLMEKGYDVSVVYCRKINAQFTKLNKDIKKVKLNRLPYLPFIHERIVDAISGVLFGFFALQKVVDNKSIMISFQSNVVAIILAKLLKIKVIVRLSNHYSNAKFEKSKLRRISEYLKKIFYKKADIVIANSQELADDYSKILGCPVKVIYNPIDIDIVKRKAEESITEEIFIKKDRPIVLGIGRLSVQKNFEFLIKSFAQSIKKVNAYLVIIGEGSERQKLEKLIKSLNLEGSVILMGHKNNVFPYLKRSDIFVLSSLYEGMPNALIEAVSLNIPSISTNIKTGPKEILLNGGGGQLVEVGSIDRLRKVIVFGLSEQEKVQKLAYNCFLQMDRFSMDSMILKYENIIEGLK